MTAKSVLIRLQGLRPGRVSPSAFLATPVHMEIVVAAKWLFYRVTSKPKQINQLFSLLWWL